MGAWVAGHRKGLLGYLAAVGAACTVLAQITDLGPVAKWAGIVVAVLAGCGVIHVPNTTSDTPATVPARPPG